MLNFTRKTYLLYFQETEHDIETFFAIKQCCRPETTKIYKELERLHEKNKFYSYGYTSREAEFIFYKGYFINNYKNKQNAND